MPEKIGKYLVRERIGRGGMGMIFKAHDPVLDRPVALKVISTDVEVTDELRARFFREAQACARLSHPNIVTVYDMGEDEGRLYIVMELLEGEELRHLIAQRRTPPLEDKLSIMVQVCGGLHYAHHKGIVHRDIKPANIFLQRNGQVKILDFGIAQMANTEGGLTRTGLIMGTLRYISPEQVRGRADHRSDIYSAGAVFYELLSMRPPFAGDDPMELLEKLRTEAPPPLEQLDPSIPPELATTIERALRKDPAERFSDLDQMRSALEEVQRGLVEEARRVGARVREQQAQFLQLRTALGERIGISMEDETIPTIDERGRLAAVQAFERDFTRRIEALRALIARADALAPAFERATQLLQDGQFADAVEEFEAIVADMPEHARALDRLAQARAQVEAERRQQLTAKLTQEARSALEAGEYTLCLEILKQAAEIPRAADVVQEIASLRETAESALAARETSRRARQQAEDARARMAEARRTAQEQADSRYAPALWNDAEGKGAEAEAALAREAWPVAEKLFDEASAAYHRFEAAAREAQQREQAAAEQAREQVAQARHRAQAAGAPQYARELWDAAEARSGEAHAAFTDKAMARATGFFTEALALFGRAEEAAHEAQQRERQHTEEARTQAAQARERASAAGAPRFAQELWDAVEAKLTEAEQALTRQAYAQAGQLFAAATDTYRRLEDAAREARRREREGAERAREQMALARRSSQAETAPEDAPTLWQEAGAKAVDAEAMFAREAFDEAREAFDTAARTYRRFEEVARETRRQRREAAERARGQAASHRERALASAAPQYARSRWDAAEAKSAAAQATFLAESLSRAVDLFTEAAALYARAEQDSAGTRQGERRRAEEAQERATLGQRRASAVDAQQHAPALWSAATAKSAEAEAGLANEQCAKAAETFNEALALYQRAESEAREARQQQRGQAELARQAMMERRQTALAADPATHAPSDWRDAEASAESGEAALAREAYTEARGTFDQATALYRRAEERARDAARAIEIARADAGRAREATAAARRVATEAQASSYAADQWRAGEHAEAEAAAALSRGEHAAARSLFTEARRQYGTAAQVASIAVEAETRRADAMVSDARRLLASGDVAACLRRLNEVLALRPGHARAQELRVEAEDRERQAAAVVQDVIVHGDRSDTERAREASGLARRAAAEAQASRYAPEQWRVSESAEAQAVGALDRQDYAAASALFAEAQRRYAAAAQAAGVAQTMETRRVDEMAAEAERLLAAGEIQDCLRRLGELLALRPGHAVADGLRLEAERRLRESEADAAKGETVYSGRGPGGLGRTVHPEERTAASAPADEGLTVLRPPTIRDHAAPGGLAPNAEAPTVMADGPAVTGAVTADPTILSPRRSQTAAADVSRRTEAPRRFTVRRNGMIAALGAVAIVVLGIASWMYSRPAAVLWPPPAVQEMAKKAATAREGAIQTGAERSAQFASGRDKQRAAEAAFERRDAVAAEQQYREAVVSYELARTAAEGARAAALMAANRAADVRKKAEVAEAPRRASSLWARGETAQRDATAALEGRMFDRAGTLFAEAEKAYQDAAQTAGGDLLKEERPKATAAQRDSTVAREDAERADARRLAWGTFAPAQQKEDEADATLDRDPASARLGFLEAQRLYKRAAQEAAAQRVTLQRAEAEQARARMTDARREAEQAGASQRAPILFGWGRKKEGDAGVAFDRRDYDSAERLFADAQADYENTAVEARRPPDGIPPAQSSAEQARRRTITYRGRAVRARADQLSEGLFGSARAKEAGADTVMKLASFDLATKGYGDAGDRYLEAARRARDRHEADGARAGMLAQKERASRKAPEYRDALAEEKQGTSAYDRDAYKEAAERFRTAQTFYAKAATRTATGSAPSPSRAR
jgi:hypothetical protein